MNTILVDRIGSVVFRNGILRVNCVTNGPIGEDTSTGTLLIPVNQVPAVIKALLSAVKEVDRRIRDQVAAANVTSPANSDKVVSPLRLITAHLDSLI